MNRRRLSVVAGLVGVALAATSCAGDDDASDASTAVATVPAASSAPDTAAAVTSVSPGAVGSTSTPPASTTTSAPTTTATAPATAADGPAPGPGAEPAVTFGEIASLSGPVDIAWRDGDDGLYVVELDGRVVRIADESQRTVLDISDLTEASGERGFLGLTFDPTGELAYVNYTDNIGTTTISEYPVDADGTFRDGDEARVVLTIEQPAENHNGGDLTFGPDGMLYIGMGDGGGGAESQLRATDMTTLLGKMLRIDPTPSDGQPYTVPADNPFVGDDDVAPEIWSSGLRNPWRFSFDRETGDLWIADVGQNDIEEIDVAPATAGVDAGKGLDFGWSAFEGDERYNDAVPDTGQTPPFSTYTHDDGRCSIDGGVRARGGEVPELLGWYVFADFCSGEVWALEVIGEGASLTPGRQVLLGEVPYATAVVDGPDGEVYVLSAAGPVVRLEPTR